jgi:hypothetical protein
VVEAKTPRKDIFIIMLKRLRRFIFRWLYAALGSVYILTLGLTAPRQRTILYQLCAYLGYQPTRLLVPQVEPSTIIPGKTVLQLHDPLPAPGEVSLLELVLICALVRIGCSQRVLEIGTLGGRTTSNLAANCSPGAEIYTLDLPGEESETKSSIISMHGCSMTQLYGDSLTFDYTSFYNKLDFIFIDAIHSYVHVISDSMNAMNMLRDDKGIIVWHDYGS